MMGMRSLRVLASHPLTGSAVRFAIAGTIVGCVYISIPLALHTGAGVPVEAAIPLAYVIAITLHFNLQRHFVFRHVDEFALSRRQQVSRYAVMAVFQYPTTALATAFLPKLLGLSQAATFVVVTVVISLTVFITLRTHIFHPRAEPRDAAAQPRSHVRT